MTARADLAIVGAGPAGMAAAATASDLGLSAVVLDEQTEPGGQIYRSIETVATERPRQMDILGPEYAAGVDLAKAFRASTADYRPQSTVWQIDDHLNVFVSAGGKASVLPARRVLMATGAMERPIPIPGWTLPGVMTCGAAQVLFKMTGVVPDGRVVVAGAGPLLLLITWQLMRAGVKVAAILETTPVSRYLAAVPRFPVALLAPGYVRKGLKWMREISQAGIPVKRHVSGLRAVGEDRITALEYKKGDRTYREDVDVLLLHEGVVPNANLGMASRIDHHWDDVERCFHPDVNTWGNTSEEGLMVAGDCRGIGGAVAAEHRGHLSALEAAFRLGRISEGERNNRATVVQQVLDNNMRARPFLDVLYRPGQETVAPRDDDTIVCRCEEVTAGTIREMVAQGCPGPNQMKAFVRSGMGPCQGRMCGLTVSEIIAEARGVPVSEVGYYRVRPPVKPVTVGELAALDIPENP